MAEVIADLMAQLGTIGAEFQFLRPWWLATLPLALLGFWLLKRSRRGAATWTQVCDPQLLDWLTQGQGNNKRSAALWYALLLAWILAAIALAGPTWERQEHEGFVKQWPRVFVMDLSAAMMAPDLSPNRLQRARFKLEDFLAETGDEQVALVTFTQEAFIAAPLTDDANTIVALLEAVHPNIMPIGGHSASAGLEAAADLIRQAGMEQGEIILITDHANAQAVAKAGALASAGIRTSVLGLGTESGAPIPIKDGFVTDAEGGILLPRLDEASLRRLAAQGAGRYARFSDDNSDVAYLLDTLSVGDGEYSQGEEKQTLEVWFERGPWLVLALIPLALLGFRRGYLLVLPILILPSQQAEAGWWDDLWQRRDQQARQYLDAGEVDQAIGLSDNPQLAGEAFYRADDYQQAIDAYAQGQDATSHYNRGNALAKKGDLAEAVKAYEQAISLAPEHEDAIFNKAIVEELLKQQDQQQQDQQQQDQQQQDQQQQDQQQQDQQQ
ncbi:MAG: VWA domain-containing protein, partial [Xanthomonadales bacterium]|nr:VWA domain-containing protein [Xanthomonadales bacterium]